MERLYSRREIIRSGLGSGAACFWPWGKERKPNGLTVAKGLLLDTVEVDVLPGAKIVRGITGHNNLYFQIELGGFILPVSSEKLQILDGDPVGKLPLNYNSQVGMRVNNPRELDLAIKLGTGFVRVAQSTPGHEAILNSCPTKTLFTHTPLAAFNESTVREEVARYFQNPSFRIDSWEVSNEPDQAAEIDPARYAELFKITQEERAKAGRFDIDLIVAAIRPANLASYLGALKAAECLPDTFAIHAYQEASAIDEVLDQYKVTAAKPEWATFPQKFIVTEWGVTNDRTTKMGGSYDRSHLINGLETCRNLGLTVAFHELPDWGWGLYDPISYHPTPYAWLFKEWVKENPWPSPLTHSRSQI